MTPPADGSLFDGLVALASLDGAPLAPRDLATLGLGPGADGFSAAARDRGVLAAASGRDAFLGYLDDPAPVAVTLGLDPSSPPAAIVRAAAARWGDDAPARLPGEWSWIAWDAARARLTLMASDAMRDALFYATDGRRVAVAPQLGPLARLAWVDASLGDGLLLHLGRAAARGALGDQTMLRGVRWTGAGTRVAIDRAGVAAGRRTPPPEPRRWPGGFDEAMEELDALLRRILRAQTARHPAAAMLLSGGLDSSLIAAYAAAERPAGASLIALTSAVAADSGLLDEVEFARAVADATGTAMRPVIPDPDVDVFLPAGDAYAELDQPLCSPRHYVYDALYRAAAEAGADAVFDGCEGEMTLTGYPDFLGWRDRVRRAINRAAHRTRRLRARAAVRQAFHVRLAPAALARAATELGDALAAPVPVDPPHRRDGVWGYSTGIEKTLRVTSATTRPGLRQLAPFRDRRLLTLFAGMPYRFLTEGGATRAPGRALLAGKVPEHVRLRTSGRPFSPDYHERLRRHAPAARARLPEQAGAGVGEWLDLAWLDGALARIGGGGDLPLGLLFEAQTTACAAALLARRSGGA